MSTLDSTFAATAKLVGLELMGWFEPERTPLKPTSPEIGQKHIAVGRIAILLMSIIGTLPMIANTEALDATTVSGTTVMGIGFPIIMLVFWKPNWKKSPLAFHLCFWFGVALGIAFQV
jgi:hypothetical protein